MLLKKTVHERVLHVPLAAMHANWPNSTYAAIIQGTAEKLFLHVL